MLRKPWTDEDNALLKSLAGKLPALSIAQRLNRTKAALLVHASQLKIPLRFEKPGRKPLKKSDQPMSLGDNLGSTEAGRSAGRY